jgi:hypothetical protein
MRQFIEFDTLRVHRVPGESAAQGRHCQHGPLREQEDSRQGFRQASILDIERVQRAGGDSGACGQFPGIAGAGWLRPAGTAYGFFTGDIEVLAAGFFRLEVDLDGEVASALDDEGLEFDIAYVFTGDWISCRDDHTPPYAVVIPLSTHGGSIER